MIDNFFLLPENIQQRVKSDEQEDRGQYHAGPAAWYPQFADIESHRAGREFVADEFAGRSEKQSGYGDSEDIGENNEGPVQAFRQEFYQGVHGEVPGVSRSQHRAGQPGPEHHVPERGIQPDYSGMEYKAKRQLQEGEYNHQADKRDYQRFFAPDEIIFNFEKIFHGLL